MTGIRLVSGSDVSHASQSFQGISGLSRSKIIKAGWVWLNICRSPLPGAARPPGVTCPLLAPPRPLAPAPRPCGPARLNQHLGLLIARCLAEAGADITMAARSAVAWIPRNPTITNDLIRTMLIGAAVAESTGIYALVISLVLIFVV